MRIQLTSSYFYVPSWNPLSKLVKWWYFDNGDGTYVLEVLGKYQKLLAKMIYHRDKMPTHFISELLNNHEHG